MNGMAIKLSSKKIKFIVAGVLIFVVVGYLVYAGIRDTRMYYLSPSEIVEMGEEAYDTAMRVGGEVTDGSIEWDAKQLLLRFRVEDGNASIPVVYEGVVPDTFENGIEIVVEGSYSPAGLFEATVLLPKCPSKYETAQ
jgi:cytochrome c-type biogenesis protein CcmE